MNQKGSVSSAFGIIVTLVIATGVGGYIYLQSLIPDQSESIPAPHSHENKQPPSSTPSKSVPPQAVACTQEAKQCPDGSVVGRHGPKCEFAACSKQVLQKHTPTISQGIYGHITFVSGNCMPGVAGGSTSCTSSKVSRKVFVYPPTQYSSAVFYIPSGNPIKEISSDTSGFYQVELPVGDFSIFVEDSGKKYCNLSDSQGTLCPVTIGLREIKQKNIEINYAASY